VLYRKRRNKPIDVATAYIHLKKDPDGFILKYIDDFTGVLAKFVEM